MNRYLKLFNFEINRIAKIYSILLLIVIVSQMVAVVVESKGFLGDANKAIYKDLMSKEDFLSQHGPMTFIHVVNSPWFLGPIAISVAGIAFYIFLIWYRDWFGKNTFIYRLLMLPTSRLNIFFSKASTVFLMVFGLVALQIILLPIENAMMKGMVPQDFRMDFSTKDIVNNYPYLSMIIPHSFIEFVLYYLAGFMAVFILFTAILFERSYRIKGILLGIIYAALAVAIFLLPVMIEGFTAIDYLYPIELLLIEIILGFIVIGVSIWMSRILLQKKITV